MNGTSGTHTTGRWASGPRFDLGRILIGLIVVVIGVLLLLEAAGELDAGRAIGDWWPAAIAAIGVFQLIEGRPSKAGPLTLIFAGGALLLVTTGVLEGREGDYLWAIAVIAAGVLILNALERATDGRRWRPA